MYRRQHCKMVDAQLQLSIKLKVVMIVLGVITYTLFVKVCGSKCQCDGRPCGAITIATRYVVYCLLRGDVAVWG